MLGIGLTWGVAWGLIGTLLGVIVGVVDPDSMDPGENALMVGALIGIVGFISGVAFSGVISFAERRKTARDLSVGRAALWGFVGAAGLPLLTTMNDQVLLVTGPLGAVFAAACVALARRADRRAPNVAVHER